MFTQAERQRLLHASDNAPVEDFLYHTLRNFLFRRIGINPSKITSSSSNSNSNDTSKGSDQAAQPQPADEDGYPEREDEGIGYENDEVIDFPAASRRYDCLVQQLAASSSDDPDTSWRVLLALCSQVRYVSKR